jgi:chromosome segregation ATPase|tara:strand:+ start:101 stop:334 length:234 start_codon:yes stop_codon:yes gene_type:complete
MEIEVQLPNPARSNEMNELIRERDFYRAKLANANTRIKSLEGDLSELQRRDNILSKRLAEIANKPTNGYRPRYRKAG